MVRDDDPVDPPLPRLAGIVRMKDPLEHYRQGGGAAQPLEPLPGEAGIGEDAEEVAHGRADVLFGRFLEAGAEDGVREVLRDSHSLEKREIGLLEIARLP